MSELTTSEGRQALLAIIFSILTAISQLNLYIQGVVIVCATAVVCMYIYSRGMVKSR